MFVLYFLAIAFIVCLMKVNIDVQNGTLDEALGRNSKNM